jgi:hypothetical protein
MRSSQLHKMYQSRGPAKNSWWWAERLPEACTLVIPMKLKFSASFGYIHKEYNHIYIIQNRTKEYEGMWKTKKQLISYALYISSNNDRHIHSTSLHLSTLHFFHLNFTQLHFTTLHYPIIWLNPIWIPYRSISLHFASLLLTSLHCTFRLFSPHLYSFHFYPGQFITR